MEVTFTYDNRRTDMVFNYCFGSARATRYEGTEDIYHIHSSSIRLEQRGGGYGSKYHEERLKFFKERYDVSYVTCVVNSENTPQVKIMNKFGWKLLDTFKSYCDETLHLYGKNVSETATEARTE